MPVDISSKETISSPDDQVLHNFGSAKIVQVAPILLAIVIILVGIATGYLLNSLLGKGLISDIGKKQVISDTSGEVKKGTVYGSSDEKVFKDNAEGVLEKGGLDGEGSHKLIRPGGDSQTVYLTSSTLSLDDFAGKKVKVWGQTYQSQKAGWFMDVGRLEILE